MLYTPDDYNQYDVLHVPVVLSLTTIYLLKHYLITALPFLATVPFVSMIAAPLIDVIPSHSYSSRALLYASIIPLLVTMAMARRVPTAGHLFRFIWSWGRILLIISVVLEVSLVILYAAMDWKKLNDVTLIFIYLDVIAFMYLLRSQRVRDTFAQFPDPVVK